MNLYRYGFTAENSKIMRRNNTFYSCPIVSIRQGSNNDDLPMGDNCNFFVKKNLDASIFIEYRHIIYHFVAN